MLVCWETGVAAGTVTRGGCRYRYRAFVRARALALPMAGGFAFRAVRRAQGRNTPDVSVTEHLSASHGQAEKWEEVGRLLPGLG